MADHPHRSPGERHRRLRIVTRIWPSRRVNARPDDQAIAGMIQSDHVIGLCGRAIDSAALADCKKMKPTMTAYHTPLGVFNKPFFYSEAILMLQKYVIRGFPDKADILAFLTDRRLQLFQCRKLNRIGFGHHAKRKYS